MIRQFLFPDTISDQNLIVSESSNPNSIILGIGGPGCGLNTCEGVVVLTREQWRELTAIVSSYNQFAWAEPDVA